MKNSITLGLLLLALGLLSACSGAGTSHFGVVTTEVFGKVSLDQDKAPAGALVLVLSKDIGFIETEAGPLYEVHASLSTVDAKGNYQIPLSDEMREVGIYFIAEGHISHRQDFTRSLGVGKYEYDVTLKPFLKWDENFSLQLKPFLSGFIVDQGYQMPGTDQLNLGNWIQKVEERIENQK